MSTLTSVVCLKRSASEPPGASESQQCDCCLLTPCFQTCQHSLLLLLMDGEVCLSIYQDAGFEAAARISVPTFSSAPLLQLSSRIQSPRVLLMSSENSSAQPPNGAQEHNPHCQAESSIAVYLSLKQPLHCSFVIPRK